MTNEVRLLIDETSAAIVDAVDGKILSSSKRQVTEKLLEAFTRTLIALDNRTKETSPQPPAPNAAA